MKTKKNEIKRQPNAKKYDILEVNVDDALLNENEKETDKESYFVRTLKLKKQLIDELKKNNGFVQKALSKLDIPTSTFKCWLEGDKSFKKKLEEVNDITNEFVESRFFERIADGDTQSILFYLKTRMKNKYNDVKTVEVKDLDFKFNFGTNENKK